VQITAFVNNHETSTRYIVIDPILRALGWELSNPTECVVEYAVARRGNYPATRVDYVLKDAAGEPAIVIEAKRIDVESDDERALDQMERYLQDIPTATMAVGHNGQYWNIAKREGNGWKAESSYPLGLHYEKTDENAQRLWEALSKEALEQECARRGNNFRAAVKKRSGNGRRR
jgi:predicted type IV restriction endonuclease